jgi:hypothetical protein
VRCPSVVFSFVVSLVCSVAGGARGDRLPADGARITRTQVLFEVDPLPGSAGYVVQVGDDSRGDPFRAPVLERRTDSLAARVEGLRFGRAYQWRYAPLDAQGRPGVFSTAYRFTVLDSPRVDPERFRFRVRGPAALPGVVLLDHARVAVDGTGRPVWFLPENEELVPASGLVRDLKVSPAGTLTFLTRGDALEIDLDGALRWRAPEETSRGPGSRGGFHHDFKRLRTGRYMVLFQEPVTRQVPGEPEPRTLHYDRVLEYDAEGRPTWSWNARDYVADVDLFSKPPHGMHMNAFDVDPDGRFVLAGFRDISRIVKIDRRSRKVVDSWGARFPSGDARAGNGFFWNQHDCLLDADGTIVVYNNNRVTDRDAPSGIVRFDPGSAIRRPRVVWRWEVPAGERARKAVAGGNVGLVPGRGYLLNMGTVNHLFLVSPESRVLWEALVERRSPRTGDAPGKSGETLRQLPYLAGGSWNAGPAGDDTSGEWVPFPQYRVSWASSLWPVWFTVEERPGEGRSTRRRVRIHNEGTEPDSYRARASGGREKKTGTVAPGAWVDLDLGTGRGEVTVRSVSDPERLRRLPAPPAPASR